MKKMLILMTIILLLSHIKSSIGQWVWQNPLPNGNNLCSVHFINNNTGCIVGENATILKTINGGLNWINKSFGSPESYSSYYSTCYFTDANTGWVGGMQGKIIKTTNGGDNWIYQSSGTYNSLKAIKFIDFNTGWAVGSFGTFLKTTNGGINWSLQIINITNHYNSVYFINTNTGWISGEEGVILKTADGGLNWQNQSTGTHTIYSVYFKDDQNGWAVGDVGTVLKTSNSGANWIYQELGSEQRLYKINFVNNSGWIFGSNELMIKTTNGGINWSSSSTNGFNILSSHFTDANTGWGIGDIGVITKTTDGGVSWISQSEGNRNELQSIIFKSPNRGWAVGQMGTILSTTNQGLNWYSQSSGTENYLYSVYFIDNNLGWVAGNGVLLKTNNGGINWTKYITGSSILYSIYFLNESTGWAAGDLFYSPVLSKTTNAGINWTSVSCNGIQSIKSVRFINNNTGWVCGIGSECLLKTTNGGIGWIPQSQSQDDIEEIYLLNENTGWTIGGSGIYKTTNGGMNWTNQLTDSYKLYSIYFTDTFNGWAIGPYGKIYKTSNGGTNWISIPRITSNSFKSVFLYNENLGWVVGYGGTILNMNYHNDNIDAGVAKVLYPDSAQILSLDCNYNKVIHPAVELKNFTGNVSNSIINVFIEIQDENNIIYSDHKQTTLFFEQLDTIYFDSCTFSADESGEILKYKIRSWTTSDIDSNIINDSIKSTFKITNPNYGFADLSKYYFLNSSDGANCLPLQPYYNWEDTTGSTSLIINSQPVVPYTEYNSFYFCGSFRLADVLPAGRKFRFFGTCYDTIIIANNGVIGFGGASIGRMNVPFPDAIPSLNAPHPAIFPLWYWVNMTDPEITGRNLKYKITDDKFIVTYDRVPLYNATIDNNDYVTYQVILETTSGCGSENGKIKVQYNYEKSGSTFINNYNNNNLNQMTIGIQNQEGDIALQYRRSESNHSVTVPGPLFGSPLALEFAPVNSVLPVELESFVSSVNENNVSLIWVVNSQVNNYGFDIERQIVNEHTVWNKIGSVAGNGTVTNTKEYSFTDKNLSTGKYKYRLKQIDYNGNLSYYELQNEVVVGVPVKFFLSQNYPNPFNPKTTIEFDIVKESNVILKVFDISGREIKTLINELKPAGYYSVFFDGSNFATGIYFYKISADNFSDVKRMMLIK